MPLFNDAEFGEITIRYVDRARSVRIRMGTNSRFVVSAPPRTRVSQIQKIIDSSREELHRIVKSTGANTQYADQQPVGKRHHIAVVSTGMVAVPTLAITREKLVVKLPHGTSVDQSDVQSLIKNSVIKIYRREAKAYLPDRLKELATHGDFQYQRIRFSHAAGRWGSCSSTGTISLNIALMKLPDALIDYVLIHELCHTVQMNHSPAFWSLVETYNPHFRLHRRQIKQYSPNV